MASKSELVESTERGIPSCLLLVNVWRLHVCLVCAYCHVCFGDEVRLSILLLVYLSVACWNGAGNGGYQTGAHVVEITSDTPMAWAKTLPRNTETSQSGVAQLKPAKAWFVELNLCPQGCGAYCLVTVMSAGLLEDRGLGGFSFENCSR